MTDTISVAALAEAVNAQRGREPHLESHQAIHRTIWELGKHLDALTRAKLLVACGLAEREHVELVGEAGLTAERQAFPGIVCPYCKDGDIVLVEQGHERTWDLETSEDLITPYGERGLTAHFHGIEDYSEDGDGDYFTRCSSCLAEFQAPDDEWEWN